MANAFRIIKLIQKSSTCVWVFRNTGANAVAKNQTRLAYEDKRDLYCISDVPMFQTMLLKQLPIILSPYTKSLKSYLYKSPTFNPEPRSVKYCTF